MLKKFFIWAIIFSFMAFALLGSLPKPATKAALKKMEKAEKAFKNKEFDNALLLYKEVMQLEPNYAPAYLLSAIVNRAKLNFEQAILQLEKAIEIQPEFPQAVLEYVSLLNQLAYDMNKKQQPEKASEYYAKIVKLPNLEKVAKKSLIEADFNLGVSYFQTQKIDLSVEAFTRLLALPGIETEGKNYYNLAQYMLGLDFNILNKYADSSTYLKKYLELTSTEAPGSFTPIAYYLLAKNSYSLLEKKIEAAKGDKSVNNFKQKVQELAKAETDIEQQLQKALALNAAIEDAYVVLGNFYYMCQDLDKTINTYKTLIEKFPASQAVNDYKVFLKKLEDEKNPPLVNGKKK
jgi:tetratricopeptide (TPR) repeat protein